MPDQRGYSQPWDSRLWQPRVRGWHSHLDAVIREVGSPAITFSRMRVRSWRLRTFRSRPISRTASAPRQRIAPQRFALRETGLVGGSIEDATGDPEQPIYEFEEAVERVSAASERAENYLWNRPDLDDIIRRLNAFSEAGADVLYAPGLPNLDAIRTVCSAVDKPVNVVMGLRGAAYTTEQLQEAGVKRVSVGGSFARAALGTFLRAAREVKNYGTFTYATEAISHTDVSEFMRAAEH
jgi:2-methylisocitrate lyase-like PEP mutase family enzyme